MEIGIIEDGHFLSTGSPCDPTLINYHALNLFIKRIPPNIDQQAEKVEYYLNFANDIYSDLAVEEVFDYQETKTIVTVKWYARRPKYTDLTDENTLYYVDWVAAEKTLETIN